MSFASLLIHTCDLQDKVSTRDGYEKVIDSYQTVQSGVPCRKDSDNTPRFTDDGMRINTDDDLFFFDKDAQVKRGQRIVWHGESFDVIKVNPLYDSVALHHFEVRARNIDHD